MTRRPLVPSSQEAKKASSPNGLSPSSEIPITTVPVRGYFITGTDTGVGKTELACGLIRAYARRGFRVGGMKPIAAGARPVNGTLRNRDVERLRAAGNVRISRRWVNPYVFAPPIAPHLAAARAGVRIDPNRIVAAYRRLAARVDVVVVEGVGGWLVPLGERFDGADLASRLDLPVIMVVGMRLGCLSHALLTAAAIDARGLRLAGWFANRIDRHMRAYRANLEALRSRLGAPLLAEIAFHARADARRSAMDRALAASPIVTCARLPHALHEAIHRS